MKYYAVIDTNVFISALLSRHPDVATVKVLNAMLHGKIIPLYHDAYLVTCNQKHYPIRDFIVTPAEMMELIEKNQ